MIKNYLIILSAILLVSLSACGGLTTPYQEFAWYRFSGGYNDKKISNDEFEVKFTSNTHTPSSTTEEYALLRAAEITKNNGFKYFVIKDHSLVYENVKYNCRRQWSGGQRCQNMVSHSVTDKIKCYNKKPTTHRKVYEASLLLDAHSKELNKKNW